MEIIINNSLTHYEVLNESASASIVILHGWGHSGFVWQTVAKALSLSHRVYLIDLPGFGHSSLGEPIHGVDDYAALVVAFIDKVGLLNITLIGHSFGAQIAVLVASQSSAVSKLVLVAPALQRQRRKIGKLWYGLLAVLAKFKRILPSKLIYHLSSGLDYTQATSRMKKIFQNSIQTNVRPLLPKITAKTLIVWGEYDREVLGSGKEIAQLIPHSQLKVIYDAGHNLHLEKPQELIRIVERYLNR